MTFPSFGFRLADAVVLFIALGRLVIRNVSWELSAWSPSVGLRIKELEMTDEYLMWSLVAADSDARHDPQSRCSTSCLCASRSLALLTWEAIPFSLSSALVQGVAQSLMGLTSSEVARMSARVALAPYRLRMRCC